MQWTSSIGKFAHDDASLFESAIYEIYSNIFKVVHRATINYPRTNIYERDWDILVILDACRTDLLREVEDEYRFVDDFDTIYSVGSSSGEWMEKTFSEEYRDEKQNTAYVTGNVKTHNRLEAKEFAVLDEAWKYAWNDEHGTILPRVLTDRAITIWRNAEPDRLIIHYMQPHFPSIPHPELGSQQVRDFDGGDWKTVSIWDDLRAGKYDFDTVWGAYLDNLRTVLDDVKLLLSTISADRVVLTSDHGNAMGEWGFYDHPGYHPLRALREVPWVETSAEPTIDHKPGTYDSVDEISNEDIDRRLKDLGYL